MGMDVLQVSFFADRARRAPERLLADWHSLGDIAESVAAEGNRVTVVQASHVPGHIRRHGVDYHFIVPPSAGSLAGTPAFRERFTAAGPQVVHVHGLGFARDVLSLRAMAPRTPILLQDHADRPPRLWRRFLWARGVAAADGVSFCARAQAREFQRPGLLPASLRVFEIPESTSHFMPGDRDAARAETGVRGDPAVLWVGHLDRNKDPLTVLDGVHAALDKLPNLMLWCCFGSAPLLDAVRARLAAQPRLAQCVRLVGLVPHARIEQFMRAADLFVLGSHREGSSFSLIEALATGLWPVVTDIPSLRALTGDGAVGKLWRCGDAGSLSAALLDDAERRDDGTRRRVRRHFDDFLSHAAVGRRFSEAYRELTGLASAVA
jgi:glycosyltransferase involved in cell wall biosynthesis